MKDKNDPSVILNAKWENSRTDTEGWKRGLSPEQLKEMIAIREETKTQENVETTKKPHKVLISLEKWDSMSPEKKEAFVEELKQGKPAENLGKKEKHKRLKKILYEIFEIVVIGGGILLFIFAAIYPLFQ